jgi:hypothetical protein
VQELRSAVRFPIQLPVAILADKSTRHEAVTSDISAGGVLFHVDTDLAVGSEIDFNIVLPAAVLGTPNDVRVNCNGRVVRSSVQSGRRTIAAVIDEYCFERH